MCDELGISENVVRVARAYGVVALAEPDAVYVLGPAPAHGKLVLRCRADEPTTVIRFAAIR